MQLTTKLFLIVGVFFYLPLQACELTEEYMNLRSETYRIALESYNECTRSISTVKYWYKFAQCVKAGDGKKIGGGCAHIAGRSSKYKALEIDSSFCEELKPNTHELVELLEYTAQKENIKKCR